MVTKHQEPRDKELIEAAKVDQKAFGLIYHKYSKRVFNYFWYRLNRDTETAQDLMQEVFLKALTNLGKFKDYSFSYLTYLLTISHNLLVDHYKKPKNLSLESLETDVPDEEHREVFTKLEQKDEAKRLWQALQKLPVNERGVLLLRYHQGFKIAEIARAKGKSSEAVKSLLARARNKLKVECEDCKVEDLVEFSYKKPRPGKPKFLF